MLSNKALLLRDKYDGNTGIDLTEDLARLAAGEPLAYVIGWTPFLGQRIYLDTKPLIPRPETEWWTEVLIKHLAARFGSKPFSLLDMCAGSGAIGIAVLAHLPNALVTFSELDDNQVPLIKKNIRENNIDPSRTTVVAGNLFEPFYSYVSLFNSIATNPPYIPAGRMLDKSVIDYEPNQALFSGSDGLDLIARIAIQAPHYLYPDGELWLECDADYTSQTASLITRGGAEGVEIRTDLYGRPRLVVGYYL
jgi:release factor glutamine methyltransferase